MKSLTKILLASSTSLGVVGGVVYYNNPQIFQNQNVQTVTQSENPAPTQEIPNQPTRQSYIPYGNLFLQAGNREIARNIREVFNYDVINPNNNNPSDQRDFEKIKATQYSGYIAFLYGSLIRNSLQNLQVHNRARNTQFVNAINQVSNANYFRNDDSSLIIFPIKSHYDLIVQYWNETTINPALANGRTKNQLMTSDLNLYLTYYEAVFDYIYSSIIFGKRGINININQFRNNWFDYFRLNLNQRLNPLPHQKGWNLYPRLDFSLEELQSSWKKANNDFYLKKTI